MTNENENKFINAIFKYDVYAFIALFIFVIFLILFKINLSFIIAIMTLIVNLYLVAKYRKNIKLFFCLISILYFNYSFIISKYISFTDNLVKIYRQIKFNDTMMIGLYSVFIFICIIGFFLSGNKTSISINTSELQKKYSKKFKLFIGSVIIAMIAVFIALAYLLGFDYLRALYEYSLILFILGFLICKGNKIQTTLLVILMLISMVLNLYVGGRIISLLPCIAFFFIFLDKYFNYQKIILLIILGVLFYTFFGLYGDIKDSNGDYSILTPKYVMDTIGERKLALDTSISSYWTGLTYIEMTNYETPITGVQNFIEYVFVYTPLGNKFSNYEQIYYKSSERYIHYYGGYLTSYFYYWLGYAGVILISCYVGTLMNMLKYDEKGNKYYDLKVIVSVYFLATLPRWYLYYPATLFRGMIILIICYVIINLISKMRCFDETNK